MSSDLPPQPAIATTKRKLAKLLDGWSAPAAASTTSLASSIHDNASVTSLADPTTPEPPWKRSRLSDVGGNMDRTRNVSGDRIKALQDKLFTPQKDTDRLAGSGLRLVGSTRSPVKTPAPTPRKAPNFAPASQEAFLGRIKTFADVKKWTSKPDAVNEVEWAKRGWICGGWNTVACKGGCEQRVVVRLRPKRKDANGKEIEMSEDMDGEIDEGLIEGVRKLIIEGHDEECLWRKAGAKDDIFHLPIPNRYKSSAELLGRYHSFKTMGADLPLLENISYPDPSVSDIVKRIPSTFWNSPGTTDKEDPPTNDAELTAFALGLFGWSGTKEGKISLAKCEHCFQRLGLWLSEDSRLKEMSAKLDIPIESLRLNIVESHREYCPWKNPDSQANPADGPISNMAAWQTLQFMLTGPKRDIKSAAEVTPRDDDSIDIGPRTSMDSDQSVKEKEDESLTDKWKRFKARLRRTTSRKSMKSSRSTKSVKSMKSGKSGKTVGEKENGPAPDAV
ncbi:zf-C3HC-domain-containing protein [Amniculicola lignicola CBS 123094]|uniref:Zf-C3HC-domain-containing protein n=1 Tax=Amniculicola lignicola CBS 123094 TaxID=1392246 RepID=A0A6A5WJQ4_9PLEO|nr:zf-C3HC-domain-containing protein [Amniculicola lignicola CBS 123094]